MGLYKNKFSPVPVFILHNKLFQVKWARNFSIPTSYFACSRTASTLSVFMVYCTVDISHLYSAPLYIITDFQNPISHKNALFSLILLFVILLSSPQQYNFQPIPYYLFLFSICHLLTSLHKKIKFINKKSTSERTKDMTLRDLPIGKTATIRSVGGEGALRQHFLDMGLIPKVM